MSEKRSATDVVVIIFTLAVAATLLCATIGVLILKVMRPDIDTRAAGEYIGSVITTIVGALVGFIGGRATGRAEGNGNNK